MGETINSGFRERNRASGIILNDKKEIILMNLTNMYFHMLPGGGVDLNESIEEALYRELKEKTGVNIQIISDMCCNVFSTYLFSFLYIWTNFFKYLITS